MSKRVWCVGILGMAAGLLFHGDCLTGSVLAGEADLSQMRQAWQQRQDQYASARVAWRTKREVNALAFVPDKLKSKLKLPDKGTGQAPGSTSSTSTAQVIFSGRKMHYTTDAPQGIELFF